MTENEGVETLTDLVAATLQPEGPDTLDTLAVRCIDPVTGYRPSRNTVWKLSRPDLAVGVKINPQLVRAAAAGAKVNIERAARAAAYQYTGLVATASAVVAGDPDLRPARRTAARWEKEEAGEGNQS